MTPSEQVLKDFGFKHADHQGVFWHWTERSEVHLQDGKFTPCDMFPDGSLQYTDESFDDFSVAADFSLNYFT